MSGSLFLTCSFDNKMADMYRDFTSICKNLCLEASFSHARFIIDRMSVVILTNTFCVLCCSNNSLSIQFSIHRCEMMFCMFLDLGILPHRFGPLLLLVLFFIH